MPLTAVASSALTVMLALQPAPMRTSGWFGFGVDPSGNRIELGLGAMLTATRTVYVDMKLSSPQPMSDGSAFAIFELELDCARNELGIISTSAYRQGGTQLSAEHAAEVMTPIRPGSQGEQLRMAVCQWTRL